MAQKMRSTLLALPLALVLGSCFGRSERVSDAHRSAFSTHQFVTLMQTLADAWNRNEATPAVDCFTEDAQYSSPPDARIRRGRLELFEFFGGSTGRPRPMRMEWHHLLFDDHAQIGAGEYTFDYDVRTHGIVIVKIVNGKIGNWREYEHQSPLSWQELIGDNAF
jgi:hypothetical protein